MHIAAAGLHSPRPRQGRAPLHRSHCRTSGGTGPNIDKVIYLISEIMPKFNVHIVKDIDLIPAMENCIFI